MSDTFTYVKIPANSDSPIEELTASKAGGLENDELVANAKAYFQKAANAERPSCEIMALTIPMAGNNYQAVSLYASDYYGSDSTENTRATQLVTACGHGLPEPIRGDVFVGRAEDNEMADIWQRVDFTSADADPTAAWCRTARSSGGGGGHGGTKASSLSGIVQQQLSNAQVVAPTAPTPMYGMNGGTAVEESWGRWTQTDDEVEVKLTIPASVKPKIIFKRNQLTINVQDETKVQGTLFGPVVPDECTYTMESVGDQKELCVTLTKAQEGTTWSYLTAAK